MRDVPRGGLILDTHVWIWVIEGAGDELSKTAIDEIDAVSRRGEVLISAISVWEVAMLEARGRISLSRALADWVDAALRAPGTRLLQISPHIAIESTRLPGSPPGDPADRIIVASARSVGARVTTRDERIIRYAGAGHLSVLDARP
jgi:PIN domain nuclease of toxin-antitoxin system